MFSQRSLFSLSLSLSVSLSVCLSLPCVCSAPRGRIKRQARLISGNYVASPPRRTTDVRPQFHGNHHL